MALNEHADYKRACPGQLRPDATAKWGNEKMAKDEFV